MVDGLACPCAPGARVRIYELETGWATWLWLCVKCLGRRLRDPSTNAKTNRTPPFGDLKCDDCGERKGCR